ncbi:hypothetical protein O181_017077 [Austropuccinia psidii MF-1]|uniref:Uncharacterized protein n=1 Tax=Austropuccinia psidii MF-1 TaxID=1389203 RepID=A0A9Q3C6X9_9BASI|nr:hypothetical protein [Austropuccinia psidii MF-1]
MLKNFIKEEEIVKYYKGWNPQSSKTKIKTIKDWNNKKREVSKEEVPVASTRKPPQEGKKNKEKNWTKPYSPVKGSQESKKYAMDSVVNISRTLMAFKEKEEKKMTQPHFLKK